MKTFNQSLREQAQPVLKGAFLRSPAQLFLIVAISIMTVESAIMFLFNQLPPMPPLVNNFADGILLTILLFPVLYLFQFRPMSVHVSELVQAEKTVRQQYEELETQVQERTQQLARRLRHRDVIERITQLSMNSASVEELLGRVLDEILAVFNADRAYFMYPCDPDAPSWTVPMECTRPEWPGVFARGLVIPMTPEVAESLREVLASPGPLPYGPAASRSLNGTEVEQFSIRSMVMLALHPRVGSPWAIGLHHCAQARTYDVDELLIFNDIGQRVADALSSMIILKNLREVQEDLVRKEKLAILGQLSGSVGHELRNPLGVMSNAVYFLKMVLAEADETTREYLNIIKHEIDNSQRIITDLLDFARTRPPQRMMAAAGELVRQSLERCIIPDNVAVTVAIPEALPRLNIDSPQLEQVLLNFITNGVQAMPDGGALLVAARLISSGVGAGLVPAQSGYPQGVPLQDFIEISVTDSGEGIPPENMKRLFQPLFTTKPRGIGLGLVVCKNLVEANGGRIEVESELSKGTTFTVLLPTERSTP